MGRPSGKIRDLENRRITAVALVENGLSAAEVARKLNIHDRTIRKWLAAFRKSGVLGLSVRVSTGRKKKLSPQEQKKLSKIILAGAVKSGFSNELWTSKRVLQVIEDQFDVKYHANHLPKLLRGLGFTPQRPQREAVEKDQKQIEHWVRYEWRRIKKKPARKERRSSS